jgi:hypothetical protein
VDEETLDQTLEILGANSLEITNDSSGTPACVTCA